MERFTYLLNHAGLDSKQYQYDGVEWCLGNELRVNPIDNVRGGLVVDEMGLGKTIMMIGTMFCNMVPRTLIVLPPILISQWSREIYRISGHKALVYYAHEKRGIKIDDLLKARIVLTSYHHITISKKKMQLGLLHRVLWDRVIFDESHHLRNKKTTCFLGCKNIRARIKWFVSGTPIQNKKNDFYNLCNALGLSKSFYKNTENLLLIRELFILNRTKKDVGLGAVLKDTVNHTIIVPWSNLDEKKVAEEIHTLLPACGVSTEKSGSLSDLIDDNNVRLMAFLRAKQACIMPSLMQVLIKGLIVNGMLKQEQEHLYLDYLESKNKLDSVITKIMERATNGRGKIVFCQYRKEIDYIASQLSLNKLSVMVFDGRAHGKQRKKMLVEKHDVLILQIQTGCEGLNLQQYYSEVYFVSPHWNPSIEEQAVARCHRIGQQEQVEVFRFIMDDFSNAQGDGSRDEDDNEITLEKYICQVQDVKRGFRKEIFG
jgi:SNF2 family DNA or RNA helicase